MPGARPPMSEAERLYMESQHINVEGMSLAREISGVEAGGLKPALREATAFEMGLLFNEGWNLDQEGDVAMLMNMFTTGEGMVERPYVFYVEQASKARLQAEIKMAIHRKDFVGAGELKSLYGNVAARRLVDSAFKQRVHADQSEEMTGKLYQGGSNQKTPDKAHWNQLFRGDLEYGTLMDRALRAIVFVADAGDRAYPSGDTEKVEGVPVSVYSRGFESTDIFRSWLKFVVSKCDGRMDIAWDAWKLALLWEVPGEFGTMDKKGIVETPPPDVGNALFTFLSHWPEKTKMEFGMKIDGRPTGQTEKFITHSGLPVMLDRIPVLLRSYLHSTKVENGEGEKRTLFDIWYRDKISFADVKFPWMATEVQNDPLAKASGEPAPGSFGYWRLQMGRAEKVRVDLLSVVSTSDLAKPTFFMERVRVWSKIFGKVDGDTPPTDNPRVWWVMAQILFRTTGSSYLPKVVRENEAANFRSTILSQNLHQTEETVSKQKVSVGDVLATAKDCGFLREIDTEFILDQLSMRLSNEDY